MYQNFQFYLGLLRRFKNGGFPVKQPNVIVEQKEVYVVQPNPPCSGNACRPKEPEYFCKTDHCRSCRNECNGNDKCHNECFIIDRCRYLIK